MNLCPLLAFRHYAGLSRHVAGCTQAVPWSIQGSVAAVSLCSLCTCAMPPFKRQALPIPPLIPAAPPKRQAGFWAFLSLLLSISLPQINSPCKLCHMMASVLHACSHHFLNYNIGAVTLGDSPGASSCLLAVRSTQGPWNPVHM